MSEGNGYATREMFLKPRKRRVREINIPDFGKVRVQSLTARERGDYESQFIHKKKGGTRLDRMKQARELLVIETVVDADGNKILSRSDVAALGAQEAAVLDRIVEAARELSGIGDDDFEELVGNSETTAGGA